MMYNVVKLRPEHWTYQRYFWHEDLDPDLVPLLKVITNLIYGVKSSENQAQRGLTIISKALREQYPAAANAILHDTYVDDCVTGVNSLDEADQLALSLLLLCWKVVVTHSKVLPSQLAHLTNHLLRMVNQFLCLGVNNSRKKTKSLFLLVC